MADEKNGQREYGIVHVVEEQMRADGAGVFATKSRAAPSNKMRAPTSDKSLSSMTKAELIDAAKAEGVEIETDDNKADLVRKIEAARG